MSGLPSVAWENVAFTPTSGSAYLKPSLLPGEPFQYEIGTDGENADLVHTGMPVCAFGPYLTLEWLTGEQKRLDVRSPNGRRKRYVFPGYGG